jgi:hypothetical protein
MVAEDVGHLQRGHEGCALRDAFQLTSVERAGRVADRGGSNLCVAGCG